MDNYDLFLSSWTTPSGGIHGYLSRFLESGDPTFQHIAIWTLLQLLESDDQKLMDRIAASEDIIAMVRDISEKQVDSDDDGDGDAEGEAEVVALAKRCLELRQRGPRSAAVSVDGNGDEGSRTLSEG